MGRHIVKAMFTYAWHCPVPSDPLCHLQIWWAFLLALCLGHIWNWYYAFTLDNDDSYKDIKHLCPSVSSVPENFAWWSHAQYILEKPSQIDAVQMCWNFIFQRECHHNTSGKYHIEKAALKCVHHAGILFSISFHWLLLCHLLSPPHLYMQLFVWTFQRSISFF